MSKICGTITIELLGVGRPTPGLLNRESGIRDAKIGETLQARWLQGAFVFYKNRREFSNDRIQ